MFCWSSHKEIPHAQGKRNPSKMVGVARGHQRQDTLKPHSKKTSQSNHTRTTALSNSMKPSHAHKATQNGQVMVERSDRMWSTGEGNGKPLQYSCLENPMKSMKRQNDTVAQTVKRLSTIWEPRVRAMGWEDPLEKEIAIHSSTIAWKIPWTEEPGRLQSMGSQRVIHD